MLLERVCGQTPSVYVNAETGKTSATVFLSPRQWTAIHRKKIKSEIKKLKHFGLDPGDWTLSAKTLPPKNWAETWKRHFKPIEIGRSLLIKPSWSLRKPRKNQAVVILDPGLSFGTGQHATTRFCLEQLVDCRNFHSRQSVLDIGTGSGILAISAAKLGYSPVRAFDFDPEAVRVSKANARLNGVEKIVQPARKDLLKLPLMSSAQYDVVCANLIYDLLISEAERIVNRVKPSGSLVLAGILAEQFPKVLKRYIFLGLRVACKTTEKEWTSARLAFKSESEKGR